MRRAAVSISSNLAEGSSRASRTDFARFVEIATGSVFEIVSQSAVGHRQGFLSEAEVSRIYEASEKQSRMLSGLRSSLGWQESLRVPQPSTLNPDYRDLVKV